MPIQIPEIKYNSRWDCLNIKEILQSIEEYFPRITDEWICDLADIELSTLRTWRKDGKARGQNVNKLVEHIEEMPDDWDPELEVGDCINSPSNWK